MRENRIRSIWKAGGAVVNGWLAIPSAFSAETMAHQGPVVAGGPPEPTVLESALTPVRTVWR